MLKGLEKAKAIREFRSLRESIDAGGLKGLEKARSLKRLRELRVLLGGDGTVDPVVPPIAPEPQPEPATKDLSHLEELTKGLNRKRQYVLDEPDNQIRKVQLEQTEKEIKNELEFLGLEKNPFDISDDDLLGELGISGEQPEPAINPLYQSVLDGAAVTIDLVKQVRAEGQKDPDHPQLRPAVRVIVETVKAMAA